MPLRAAMLQEMDLLWSCLRPHVCCCGLHGVRRRTNILCWMKKKLLQRRNLHEECYVWVFGVSVSEDWFSWQRWFCVFCSLGRVLLVLFCNIRVGVHYKKLITWPNQPKRLTGSKPFGDVGSSMVVEGDLWKPCTLGPLCVVCWQFVRKFVFVISIVFGSMDEIGQTSIQTIYDM